MSWVKFAIFQSRNEYELYRKEAIDSRHYIDVSDSLFYNIYVSTALGVTDETLRTVEAQ